jgi:hypothetical protein
MSRSVNIDPAMNHRVFLLLAFSAAVLPASLAAAEPPWNPSAVKSCDRSCLTGIIDRYTTALQAHDRAALPLAEDVRFTENTAPLNAGEGLLWHARTEPTSFKYYVADPVAGQAYGLGDGWTPGSGH